jgi:NADPH-dependent glutamate synthase beta subunit-like oxidoreductase/NAD(P)H-flavin reductase
MNCSNKNFLNPSFNLTFQDLYNLEGLKKINFLFENFLKKQNIKLAENFFNLTKFDSEVLIEVSIILEEFLSQLFLIKEQNESLKFRHQALKKIYQVRREFIQRHVLKKFNQLPFLIDGKKILKKLNISFSTIDDLEIKISEIILNNQNLEELELYAIWALFDEEGKKFHQNGSLFLFPKKTDHQNLIQKINLKERSGFNLTDNGYSLNRIQAEAHYCIFCHKQKKDSCRKGLLDQKSGEVKIDPLKNNLSGCPLDQKISEMNLLKSEGFSISALSIAMVDNPMIAGTGSRICNDCSKACIYQKQEPVDIPQVETKILKDILSLPYGFEIYSLLTRWNPLKIENKLPQENKNKKVLICGLGPAGYTLAHYLLNDGFEVFAIDGLKIEPLNPEISGKNIDGNSVDFKPIKSINEIYEQLSDRTIGGFGGVVEYGITVRFDKNFLKIIRLILERRKNFHMFGGLRFGSSIDEKTAFENYDFDHIALCIGAGKPNIIEVKNNFSKGVKLASDFLMSLQLTGAFRKDLFTNLQIRMPIVVIGGGLTAIDTACEAQAYYFVQVQKFAEKIAILGKEKIWQNLNEEERQIAEEFLSDAKKIAQQDKNFPKVKILYRKKMQDSPAYRLNHQELEKAMEEGIEFIENISPIEIKTDSYGWVEGLKCDDQNFFSCKTVLIAAGTSPNISPITEDGLQLEIEGKYPKFLPSYQFIAKINSKTNQAISFFGDLHKNFEGNVVKAMASAKRGYKEISKILEKRKEDKDLQKFCQKINEDFAVKINRIVRLSDHVIEIEIKAPLLANQTKIGQIFRLQNYHFFAKKTKNQLMAMEGVAVTALKIDQTLGLITGIVVESGGSTSLIKNFKENEICVFMGPSGKPTEISQNETVVLIGGGRGNQPLAAIAEEFKKQNCKIIFFAGYRKKSFIVQKNLMKKFSDDLIISISDEKAENDNFQGSVIDSVKNYFSKNNQKIDRIFAIGNNYMMHEIAKLRHQNIVSQFAEAKISITSLNAPMQCMMKGVCSQCLQKRKNKNGEDEYFYACANQDQSSDNLNFEHLHNRCEQNSLSEKITKNWIEYLE